jgi:hypothetical protein
MDWSRHYDALMARARGRDLVGYSERHHILPKCMGGTNAKGNLVRLTAKEHFIAHKMLVRMNPEVRGLWLALVAMGRIPEFKARIFASEREAAARSRRGFKYTDESKAKMSASARARGRNSPNTEFKKNQKAWNSGLSGFRKGYSHNEETRVKMIKTQRENREAHSATMRQWWADRKASLQRTGG